MSDIKVLMLPHISHFRTEESGIKRVVEAYFKYLPQFGIELVDPDATTYDVKAVHAGMTGADNTVCHLHGLYWSADNAQTPVWEWEVNSRIVEAIRHTKALTVPSDWVAETIRRDLRYNPFVIGHGVDWDDWQHDNENLGYILWNKNRQGDVCSPDVFNYLARNFRSIKFLATFGNGANVSNLNDDDIISTIQGPDEGYNSFITGVRKHQEMKRFVQHASVYLSSTKETFGIGVLEALAAGVPVLGVNLGGNRDLIDHGVNGYLYESGNFDDMAEGLTYCIKYRDTLGENGREMARGYTWERAVEKVAEVYRLAMVEDKRPVLVDKLPLPLVSVVIPCHNKASTIKRAIDSIKVQTLNNLECLVVLDNCSDNSLNEVSQAIQGDLRFSLYQVNHGNVADTRNFGASQAKGLFLCFLDGDDWIDDTFLEVCVNGLLADRSLGATYAGLTWHKPDGSTGLSPWPTDWNYNDQLAKKNQIPTCSVIRKEAWDRLGGQRSRYCGYRGAGAEDGEFHLRLGAYGWGAKKVTDEGLFHYSWMSGIVTGDPNYSEPDYQAWHSWVRDGQHPFASYATPKKLSHPVRQYDEPLVSVIIPVGPGHEKELINALDSLEAQTFRKWEVVVVWDYHAQLPNGFNEAYPYVRQITTKDSYFPGLDMITAISSDKAKSFGAGFCRNRGVELARANLILYLDADDTLHPEAIERMLEKWNETGNAVYSDYVGQAFIDDNFALSLDEKNRLQSFNPKTGEAIIGYQAFDFDCERALRQPEIERPYIWNLITTLFPKAWHVEIGGFDEEMDTWEDWDYWLRMARAGHCFSRLPLELVRYRFYTGQRRALASGDTEEGRQKANAMIEYITRKYESEPVMGCGCRKNGTNAGIAATVAAGSDSLMAADSDFVRARYLGKGGNHHIIGATKFNQDPILPSRRVGDKWVLYYGYKGRGHETYVHKKDIDAMVGKWMPLAEVRQPEMVIRATPEPVAVAAPKPVSKAEALGKLAAAKEKAQRRVKNEE